jgi:hypothetical protein
MDPLALVVLTAGLSLVPIPLIYRCLRPKTAIGISGLVSLGSAGLAVTFFWLWQRLEQPVLAYLDAIVYGSLAFLALMAPINRRLGVYDPPERGA